ncbi:hypothetical protein Rs2_26950 [Raphanus sativus]|nr:hypothetical protein Rs2_26950 [Raphanus sativus]
MDPCTFLRITVGNLVVRASPSISDAAPGNWFCKIKFKSFPRQVVAVPVLFRTESESQSRLCSGDVSTVAACFILSKAQIEWSHMKPERSVLSVKVYSSVASCGLVPSLGVKLIGCFNISLDLKTAETRTCLAHHEWVELGTNNKSKKKNPDLHVSVRVEPDRRFMFEFEGEPECSPKVFLVHGNKKQAVFTCKFGIRNSPILTRLPSLTTGKKHTWRERKGWSIMIHDLSGSAVAMASITTPFVPSPGSKRVSKSSPGEWLILRPDGNIMKPWGRLEAWREPGFSDVLGYQFHLFQDDIATEISSSSSIRAKFGGSFVIDGTIAAADINTAASLTPSYGSFDLSSRLSSGSSKARSGCGSDFGFLLPQAQHNLGFVMSTRVEGVEKQSRPKVEVGEKYVRCVEDAAAHVALAAAVDLSMDACRLFSHKIRRELRQPR